MTDRMARRTVALVMSGVLLTACASPPTPTPVRDGGIAVPTTLTDTTPGTGVSTPASSAALPAMTSVAPAARGPELVPGQAFVFEAQPLPEATRRRMAGPAWRPGCPVALDDLRTIRLSFWGFDGKLHKGDLVVHSDAVATMRGVFAELHAARWPIRQIRPIEDYGGDDDASMDADNTSAFNCRPSTGTTSTWSQHAYGRAIDINPRENPYVTPRGVEPKAGEAFVDRTTAQPGLIGASSVVVNAFDRRGWGWGGRWSGSKDYQHFSSTGR